ncbi:DUF1361 domain-containing protein [Erysipelotrichaceae bacterium OttesenSCG-928-M19]|nr:DUF1361 domain-containing protein [Erysipelotrichaceae bacterium OttesenSCG-928-M19]
MNKINMYVRVFLISFLALVLLVSNYTDFYISFLIINMILAYIPFEISCFINKVNNKLLIILLSLLWLLFYPNAPYLVTDFFHLEALNIYELTTIFNFELYDWLEFAIVSCGLIFGLLIGIISLFRVIKKLQMTFFKKESKLIFLLLAIIITIASGYAIYLGRFPRLHSHYLFTNPRFIIDIIINSINKDTIIFSIGMALWQIPIIYLIKLFKDHD